MKRLIECVPNFSEGRDTAKVDALVDVMRGVPGVFVLDRESDADHNRSVVTLVGEPDAVAEAVLRGVGKAAETIDLTHHTGAHPRIGATDVLPFIPIEGCTIDDCVALARRVGREIWERYRIPVYFYESAATRPDRVNLENVRKGQFEGLREDALRDPDRAPDVGEPRLHATAGAIAVGARKVLIAYNINLNTPDVSIAKKIAKAIRFSTGGLRYVKAMGVDLKARGLAQVSINLTDFEQTPLHRVFEMVKREAEHYGCAIVGSEIVGLIPRKALELSSEFYLQFENFSPSLVLENRIASALEGAPSSLPVQGKLAAMAQPFLDAVSAPAATPGGGSVAAMAGALAASLGEMVAGISRQKKSQSAFVEDLTASIESMRQAARTLAAAIDRDAQSYEAVMSAFKLPKETAAEKSLRDAAIERATRHAAEVPMETAVAAVEIFEKLVQLQALAAPSMLSDLQVARGMATAAARGALENVAINLASLHDQSYVSEMKSRTAAVEARLTARSAMIGR
jgi:glutamate formiminotransferase/formiminotetrahydrofolate cyclodeaminase